MKQSTFIAILMIAVSLSFGSCLSGKSHGASHPAVNKTGRKAFLNSQDRLSHNYGGRNTKRPNKFKKKHF